MVGLNEVDYSASGGFELVLEFTFDRTNDKGAVLDSGYVTINTDTRFNADGTARTSPQYDRKQLDFFGNSGVKIADFYEIGIFDTNALLDETTNLDVVEQGDIPPKQNEDLGMGNRSRSGEQ